MKLKRLVSSYFERACVCGGGDLPSSHSMLLASSGSSNDASSYPYSATSTSASSDDASDVTGPMAPPADATSRSVWDNDIEEDEEEEEEEDDDDDLSAAPDDTPREVVVFAAASKDATTSPKAAASIGSVTDNYAKLAILHSIGSNNTDIPFDESGAEPQTVANSAVAAILGAIDEQHSSHDEHEDEGDDETAVSGNDEEHETEQDRNSRQNDQDAVRMTVADKLLEQEILKQRSPDGGDLSEVSESTASMEEDDLMDCESMAAPETKTAPVTVVEPTCAAAKQVASLSYLDDEPAPSDEDWVPRAPPPPASPVVALLTPMDFYPSPATELVALPATAPPDCILPGDAHAEHQECAGEVDIAVDSVLSDEEPGRLLPSRAMANVKATAEEGIAWVGQEESMMHASNVSSADGSATIVAESVSEPESERLPQADTITETLADASNVAQTMEVADELSVLQTAISDDEGCKPSFDCHSADETLKASEISAEKALVCLDEHVPKPITREDALLEEAFKSLDHAISPEHSYEESTALPNHDANEDGTFEDFVRCSFDAEEDRVASSFVCEESSEKPSNEGNGLSLDTSSIEEGPEDPSELARANSKTSVCTNQELQHDVLETSDIQTLNLAAGVAHEHEFEGEGDPICQCPIVEGDSYSLLDHLPFADCSFDGGLDLDPTVVDGQDAAHELEAACTTSAEPRVDDHESPNFQVQTSCSYDEPNQSIREKIASSDAFFSRAQAAANAQSDGDVTAHDGEELLHTKLPERTACDVVEVLPESDSMAEQPHIVDEVNATETVFDLPIQQDSWESESDQQNPETASAADVDKAASSGLAESEVISCLSGNSILEEHVKSGPSDIGDGESPDDYSCYEVEYDPVVGRRGAESPLSFDSVLSSDSMSAGQTPVPELTMFHVFGAQPSAVTPTAPKARKQVRIETPATQPRKAATAVQPKQPTALQSIFGWLS